MARESSGFSKGDLDNALGVRDATKQIGQFLKAIGADASTFSRDFAAVSREADNFATYQANAVKSTKNVNKLLEKANNLRGVANKQQAEASRYFTQATKLQKAANDLLAKGTEKAKQQAKVLQAQAKEQEDIAKALDAQVGNSTALANQFETLGKTSQDLSRNVYGTAAAISDTLGLSNHLTTSFEDANEIQRQKQIIQEDELELQGKINAAFDDYLEMSHKGITDQKEINKLRKEFVEEGKGMTAKRLGRFGLEGITEGTEKGVAAERIKSAQKGMSNTKSALPSELGTMMKGLGKAIGALAKSLIVLKGIAKIVETVEYAVFGIDKEVVDLSRAFGLTKAEGRALRDSINESANAAGILGSSVQHLVKMQLAFTEATGMSTKLNTDQLKTMSLMTRQLGLSTDSAVHLTEQFKASGVSSEEGLSSMIETYNNMKLTGKATTTFKELMKDITGSAELQRIAMTQGAEAAMRTAQAQRRTGLSLAQQRSMAEGTLDFEKTMTEQLELQMLTGKDINLQKAQELALQGKNGQAVAEMQKQMGKLTAKQRENPLIMNKMLSILGMSREEYYEMLNTQAQQRKETKRQLNELKLLEATTKELQNLDKKRFTSAEQFTNTLSGNRKKLAKDELDTYLNSKEYQSELAIMKLNGIKEEEAQQTLLNKKIGEFAEKQIHDARVEAGLLDAKLSDYETTVSAAEAFNMALEKVQGQLAGLIRDGVIDDLTDMLVNFTKRVAQVGLGKALLGYGDTDDDLKEKASKRESNFGQSLARFDKTNKSNLDKKNLAINNLNSGSLDENTLVQLHKALGPEAFKKYILNKKRTGTSTKGGELNISEFVESDAFKSKIKTMDDFILRPGQDPISFNKGDLVMGGTQLGMGGGKVEQLLEELLAETKAGKVIKMDAGAVGRSLQLNASKMSY